MPSIDLASERLAPGWLRCLPSALAGIFCLAVCAGVFADTALARTNTSVSGLPANAAEKPYGGGWTCDQGFQASGETCGRVIVPANGFLDGSGTRWNCERGYLRNRQACKA